MSASVNNTKRIFISILWLAIIAAGVVLLVAAVRTKDVSQCMGVEIDIIGVSNNFFIDKADVRQIVSEYCGGKAEGKRIAAFNLAAIEARLEKNVWVKNAELYFDSNDMLRISIDEREPVARIFSITGGSFYIDSSTHVLPLSEKFSARLPVFTSFRSAPGFISKADSNLLQQVKDISLALQKDSFLMAMIEQVDITPQRSFEMIPKIGNQLIVFGNADNIEDKCNKLKLFYREVITKTGWNYYSQVNLQFKNQVVAKRSDAADKTSDSLRALQIMKIIAERAEKQAADSIEYLVRGVAERPSADSSMIQQSMERTEPQPEDPAETGSGSSNATGAARPAIVPAARPATPKPKPAAAKPPGVKPVTKPPAKPAQKPKAVMVAKD